MTSTRASSDRRRRTRRKKPLYKRAALWVPVGIVVGLMTLGVGGALTAKTLYNEAMSARDDLQRAIPLVDGVQASMLAGDNPAAQQAVAQIAELTGSAKEKTSGGLWQSLDWVPVAGENLKAVRIAASSADALVKDAVTPLTSLSLDALVPQGGVVDIARLQELAGVVDKAASSVDTARADLETIDRGALIDQVVGGVDMLDDAIAKVEPFLEPADKALTLLPKALGAEGPRNYLLVFQNNAESRGSGGNPAAVALITADGGSIALAQQAGSGDFTNGRAEPIIPLDPETQALYGDKIGRYVMDTTLTPSFPETAELVKAFWSESFGTPVDAVASFDPVALSYLLQATGPVTLPTGETLTADNAVPLLLNEVYSRYPEPEQQDVFFAGAAGAVFSALLNQSPDPRALVDVLALAANEGRLMYAPSDPAEAEVIAGTRVNGTFPEYNSDATVMGAYVNDVTEGKLDYYMQLAVAASTTQCQAADEAPVFGLTATLTNTLDPAAVPDLADYVSPARFFPKGVVSTDLVLYAPVGATLTGVTVNGEPADVTPMPHLGRNTVKVNVETAPGVTAAVAASFSGAPSIAYGPLEIRHTPMVHPAPVTIDAPGCEAPAAQ